MMEARTVTIATATGPAQVTGATASAIRKALESADPDAVVCFGFEVTSEVRFLADNSEMLMGAVCFIAHGAETVLLLGQEAVSAAHRERGQ